MKTYKIFPSIGIARVGDSDGEYFIGPEAPGVEPAPPYRDSQGKIKRQGARFRIYEFEVDRFGGETCKREITYDTNTKIVWTVHLANKKAAGKKFPLQQSSDRNHGYIDRNHGYNRKGLIIDARLQKIEGKDQDMISLEGDISFIQNNTIENSEKVKIGNLKTDEAGRLIVLGGHGKSKSISGTPLSDDFANHDGWCDDVSDGPVTAQVIVDNQTFEATPAWVVIAPPAFAPAIYNITTWYDQAMSVNAEVFNPGMALYKPSFTRDIYPILKRTVYLQWVSEAARSSHGPGTRGDFLKPATLGQLSNNSAAAGVVRDAVFKRLAKPGQSDDPNIVDMPKLRPGVNPKSPADGKKISASLSNYQYELMRKWKNGDFDADWEGSEPPAPTFDNILLKEQPDALTRAALESCVGGPFYPGIETTYLMAVPDTYSSPFRINPQKSPGDLTELMALPWQADFLDCGALWWPAQRPVSVQVDGIYADYSRGIGIGSYKDMIEYWSHLGFIVEKNGQYIEVSRKHIPSNP